MEVDSKRVWRKFWALSIIAIAIILSFFVYGFYFDIWGKKFSELPRITRYIDFVYLVAIFGFGYVYTSFLIKYDAVLSKSRKRRVK